MCNHANSRTSNSNANNNLTIFIIKKIIFKAYSRK